MTNTTTNRNTDSASPASPPTAADVRRILMGPDISDPSDVIDVLVSRGHDRAAAQAAYRDFQGEQAEKHGGRVGLLAQRVPLGSLLRDGVPEPTFLPSPTHGERLFYEGHAFLFAGHKKAGKSWSMTLQTRDLIAAGRPVVYIDNENGRELFADRLAQAGGITPEQADAHLHYVPFPESLKLSDLRAEFDAIREALPGAFVVVDSLRSLMARFGLSPNREIEVEQFFGPIMAAVKSGEPEGRLTVGVIDHSNRSTSASSDYAAAGSAAKAQAVDAVYYFDKIAPFSRDQEGAVSIAVKDDRRGLLDFERRYRVGGQGEGQPFVFRQGSAEEFGTDGRILLDVRQALMDADEPMTMTAIRNAVRGDNGKIDATMGSLLRSEPHVVAVEGTGGRMRYQWTDTPAEASDALPM